MYKAGVALDKDVIDTIQAVAQRQPEIVAAYVRREVRPFVSQQVDKRLRRPPGPVKYPIDWPSEAYRQAYLATDGFGHGIPYKRTGRLVKSWEVRGDYTNTFSGITVENTAPYARRVVGADQWKMFANTGWPYAPSVLQTISLLANDFAADGIADVMRQELRHGSA